MNRKESLEAARAMFGRKIPVLTSEARNTYRLKAKAELELQKDSTIATLKPSKAKRQALIDWFFEERSKGARSLSHILESFVDYFLEELSDPASKAAKIYKPTLKEKAALDRWYFDRFPKSARKSRAHKLAVFLKVSLSEIPDAG